MEKIIGGMKRAILLIVILFLFVGFFSSVFANPSSKGFEVDNVLLKLMVGQGESVSKTIKITNIDSMQRDFKATGNMNFFSISEQEFSLGAGESKSLEINFETEKQPGVYIGNILVSSGKEELKIPVILEIESQEVLFDSSISVPLEYDEVYPGGSIAVESKIFNLENLGLKSVDITYAVKDFNGNTIFSEKENIAVENQILTTKLISIPESAKAGDYVLYIVAEYSNSVGTSSYFFKISEKQEGALGSIKFFDSWIFIAVLFAVIIFFVVFTKQRDKLFLEFEKQHKQELRKEIEKLNKEREKIKKLGIGKRKKKLKEFRENEKKRLKAVKIIYRTRIKVLKKLKKQKKKSEMQKKLGEWKKQGYNTDEFLINTGKSGKKSGKDKIKDYKKQGYKI